MSFQIVYSPAAIRDLDRVWAEIFEASKSEEIAANYLEGLMDHVAEKKHFPKSGSPLYYESSFTGYYFVTFKAYMAFYRVQDNQMMVDRIVFGKSDYMRILFRQS